MKGDYSSGASPRCIILVVGSKPKLVAPYINEQDSKDAEHIKADFFYGEFSFEAPRQREAPEMYAESCSVVLEREKGQSEENIQHNPTTGNQSSRDPKGSLLKEV